MSLNTSSNELGRWTPSDPDLGSHTDSAAVQAPLGVRLPEVQPRRARATDELHERDPLVSYFGDIGGIPTLQREHEILLAKEIESATHELRTAILSIPWTAEETVRTWLALRGQNRVTGKLSESFNSSAPTADDLGERVDTSLAKVERLLLRRAKLLVETDTDRAVVERLDGRMARLLGDIDPSLRLLERVRVALLERGDELEKILELRRSLSSKRRAPRSDRGRVRRRAELLELARRQTAIEAEVGIPAEAYLERIRSMEDGWERLTEFKNRFVQHNLKLVITLAKDFRNMGIPFQDLIQEGNIGLMRAVEKFDHRRGFKFSTYAVWWIRQALVRTIQNHSRTIRIPSHLHDTLRKYHRARNDLERELGREPTAPELARFMELDEDRVKQLEGIVREPVSLEKAVPGTDSKKLQDTVRDPDPVSPVKGMDHSRLEHAMHESMQTLCERERNILRWRFGLDGGREHTLEEIGRKLSLSRERVRQLEARALEQLRSSETQSRLVPFVGADEL
ncbi:MAG: sigma-70 family RNA polymerase sigma factor [Myxococcota bacterium]